jgi:WD40 repeat protein
MLIKFLHICLLFSLLTLHSFAQDEPPSPVKLIGKFDFDNPSERIIRHEFLDNNTRLWMLGANTVQLWDVVNKKVISSEPHGIEGLSKETLGGLSPDRQKILVLSSKFNDKSFVPDPVTGAPGAPVPDDVIFSGKKSGLAFRKAAVWDLNARKRLMMFEKPVYSGGWSKDGNTFFASSYVESSYLLDSHQDEATYDFFDSDGLKLRSSTTVKDVVWTFLTPDGSYFYSASSPEQKGFLGIPWVNGMARVVNIWNTRAGQMEKGLSVGGEEYATLTWKLYPSPSGRNMVMVAKHKTRDADHKLIFWELNGSAAPKYIVKANPRIRDSMVRYSPDEQFFAIDAGKNVQIYNAASGELKSELKDAELPAYWMDDNRLALDIYTKRMGVIDTATGDKRYDLPLLYITTQEPNNSYTTDSNGNVTYGTDTVVADYTRVKANPDRLNFLTFSNRLVKIFDVRQGNLLATVLEPSFSVVKQKYGEHNKILVDDAGWSEDGKIVYVVDSDRRAISLWDFKRN